MIALALAAAATFIPYEYVAPPEKIAELCLSAVEAKRAGASGSTIAALIADLPTPLREQTMIFCGGYVAAVLDMEAGKLKP